MSLEGRQPSNSENKCNQSNSDTFFNWKLGNLSLIPKWTRWSNYNFWERVFLRNWDRQFRHLEQFRNCNSDTREELFFVIPKWPRSSKSNFWCLIFLLQFRLGSHSNSDTWVVAPPCFCLAKKVPWPRGVKLKIQRVQYHKVPWSRGVQIQHHQVFRSRGVKIQYHQVSLLLFDAKTHNYFWFPEVNQIQWFLVFWRDFDNVES